MSFSFCIHSKSQSKKPTSDSSSSVFDAAKTVSPAIKYVTEFRSDEAPPPDFKIKPIPPLPSTWCPNKRLKNLATLPQLSQSLQFELDPGSNPKPSDSSMGYGLNLRQPSATGSDVVPIPDHGETISDLELRRLKVDLENLPEDPTIDEYDDVPVEGFGAALLSGYGWKEGSGIGRNANAKEGVKVSEVIRKEGRVFTGEFLGSHMNTNLSAGDDLGKAKARPEKVEDRQDKKGYRVGKEVRMVNGREMGMKGKIVEVRDGGDLLILRLSNRDEKVKVRIRDVAEVGSSEEEKCLRKLEMKVRTKNVDYKDRNHSRTSEPKEEKARNERVNWLRNHIRVRIISQKLKGGRLYLKKGVIVDVVGPRVCDISIDRSNELVQGVDQEFLETALPKRGGPVVVLYGRHKGVYGNLLERDSEKEMAVVRDADTHELLNVKLEEVAEYVGDPSDIVY
ncbi:hypothetical protein OROMI_025889 [Orobanche minor]